MTTPTDAAIIRRLAEYDGYTDIAPMIDGGRLYGHQSGCASVQLPDYPNDVAAAIRVCERIADERGLSFSVERDPGEDWFVLFVDSAKPELLWMDAAEPTLARAAALAAFQALDT
jgi:hypothetical protein